MTLALVWLLTCALFMLSGWMWAEWWFKPVRGKGGRFVKRERWWA